MRMGKNGNKITISMSERERNSLVNSFGTNRVLVSYDKDGGAIWIRAAAPNVGNMIGNHTYYRDDLPEYRIQARVQGVESIKYDFSYTHVTAVSSDSGIILKIPSEDKIEPLHRRTGERKKRSVKTKDLKPTEFVEDVKVVEPAANQEWWLIKTNGFYIKTVKGVITDNIDEAFRFSHDAALTWCEGNHEDFHLVPLDKEKAMIRKEDAWVIMKGGYFYRENSQGYTPHIEEAGWYTYEDALSHQNSVDAGTLTIHKYTDIMASQREPEKQSRFAIHDNDQLKKAIAEINKYIADIPSIKVRIENELIVAKVVKEVDL